MILRLPSFPYKQIRSHPHSGKKFIRVSWCRFASVIRFGTFDLSRLWKTFANSTFSASWRFPKLNFFYLRPSSMQSEFRGVMRCTEFQPTNKFHGYEPGISLKRTGNLQGPPSARGIMGSLIRRTRAVVNALHRLTNHPMMEQ